MKKTINVYDFRDEFVRMSRRNSFSYEGSGKLFEYLEQYENDCGEEIELDVIALCGEFSEYESIADFQKDYGEEYKTLEDIEKETIVIPVDNDSFIIQSF